MDSTIRNIILFFGAFILLKFFLRTKIDKDVDVAALIASGALLVDVRTSGEFSGSHIKGAINLPVSSISIGIKNKAKTKTKSIIVYCHSGARSGTAKKILIREGYTNVINAGSLHRMRALLGK